MGPPKDGVFEVFFGDLCGCYGGITGEIIFITPRSVVRFHPSLPNNRCKLFNKIQRPIRICSSASFCQHSGSNPVGEIGIFLRHYFCKPLDNITLCYEQNRLLSGWVRQTPPVGLKSPNRLNEVCPSICTKWHETNELRPAHGPQIEDLCQLCLNPAVLPRPSVGTPQLKGANRSDSQGGVEEFESAGSNRPPLASMAQSNPGRGRIYRKLSISMMSVPAGS
jgi:hypothetical protein